MDIISIETHYLIINLTFVAVAFFIQSAIIAEEKEKHTLRGLMLSPATLPEILTGKSLVSFVVTGVTLMLCITIASWVSMTTTIGSVAGSGEEYVLSNDVTQIDGSALNLPHTHIIGLGGNANHSVVSNSEFMTHNYYLPTGGDFEDFYGEAYKKDSVGYAFVNEITSEIASKYFMALRITPNLSGTTVVDGYGTVARYTKGVSPQINFGATGASISITPTSNLNIAPGTHVQY